ncbi:serine/threonine-protein kinase DCLK2, partial [Leptonychotes weddellii]|uniref:non-specific serine/threonine protein kinase n=1 Tax=Leptonychotes weddellii TaxID=9713 RepID=A0A7F8RND7_LEPWE
QISAHGRSSSNVNGGPELGRCMSPEGVNGNRCSESSTLLEKYKIGKVIGDGNFAVVKECMDRSTGKEFALKIIDKAKCCGKEHLIENEVSILRRVKHPNIIMLVEEMETATELFLVMELVKGGDLFDAITSSTKYTERDGSAMVYNLANALRYLHGLSIVHRDIKPENLLVCEYPDGTKSLKLGDFGLATVVEGPLYTVCGTPTYVAPEIIAETGYGLKVDIWAAGVITYILLCGFPPFRSENNLQEDLFDQILAGKLEFPAPYWDNITDSAKELISQMLQVNVEARCTAGEILSHPWVSDDASQENNMQAEVTGKLKQHFNNALPKQNSTTTGVSVIMVSGRHPVLLLESGSVWPDCSADIESLEVNSQGLSFTWKLAPSMFLFSLQDWLGTWSAPIWLTPGPGVLGGGGCAGPASWMGPGAKEPLASPPGLGAVSRGCFCCHLFVSSGEGFPSLGGFTVSDKLCEVGIILLGPGIRNC